VAWVAAPFGRRSGRPYRHGESEGGRRHRAGERRARHRHRHRAFLLREELRLLYHLPDPDLAPAHLDAWLAGAARSRLRPFVRLARTLRSHRDGILAAIRLGLTMGATKASTASSA